MGSAFFKALWQHANGLVQDRRGATTVEYGLLVGLIGMIVLITIGAIGEKMRDNVFGVVVSTLQSVLG